MYRDESLSLEETIARLEAEVCELRALGSKQRERRLVVTAVVGLMIAIHAVIACVATKVQADRANRDLSKRLVDRTNDLVSCVQRFEERSRKVDACRAQLQACDCAGSPWVAAPDSTFE
ncbi:MAG: hypothetical protein JOZ69_00405 [Myxococcales bacterium]|nr:hypothetical protein [Myxococcales bacterium]